MSQTPADEFRFRSPDQRYGIDLHGKIVDRVLAACAGTGRCETGGIIVGSYNRERTCAIVSDVGSSPQDSLAGASWYSRGVKGVQQWLNSLWWDRRYYLGEWHFHPFGVAVPSDVDVCQMLDIAGDPLYSCPEPILVIVGGDPHTDWHVGAFQFLRGRDWFPLALC